MPRTPFPISLTKVWAAISGRMRWRDEWVSGQYLTNDTAWEETFVGVANKDTTDHLSPQNNGSPFYLYDSTIPETSDVAKQVLTGARYTVQTAGSQIVGFRVYTFAGQHYQIWLIQDPLGSPVYSELLAFTASTTGWNEFGASGQIVTIGTQFDVGVITTAPDPVTAVDVFSYDYLLPNNAAAPAVGEISHANKATESLRINKTAQAAADATAALEALSVGDTISGGGIVWTIQAITDNTTWIDFTVTPQIQGTPAGVQDFTFTSVTAQPTEYAEDVDWWLSAPEDVKGFKFVDTPYDPNTLDDNAYGIDLEVQALLVSDDWDLLPNTLVTTPSSSSDITSAPGDGTFPRVYETDPQASPITVSEGGPPTSIISLHADTPEPGLYRLYGGFAAEWAQANDKLIWRLVGDFATDDFNKESKEGGERLPFSLEHTVTLNGTFTVTLEAETTGPGAADVTIDTASIFMQRIR